MARKKSKSLFPKERTSFQPTGAQAWATLASVLRTARQQGRILRDTLSDLIERHWSGQEPGFLASG